MSVTTGRAVRIIAVAILAASVSATAQDGMFGDLTSLENLLNTEISTASKYKQTANEAPASITIVTAEEIERFGYQTLAQALNSVRGLYVTYDRAYHYIGARGFQSVFDTNNRILLLLNGQAMNESLFGSTLIGDEFPIDLNTVERVEIVRGPGSVLYGTNAMFLVVNVVMKDGARFDGGSATFNVGEFGERVAAATYGKSMDNRSNALVSVRAADNTGKVLNSEEFGIVKADAERFAGVFGSVNVGGMQSHVFYSNRRKSLPFGVFGATFGDTDSRTDDERFATQVAYDRSPTPMTHLSLRGVFAASTSGGRFANASARSQRSHGVGNKIGGEARFAWDMRVNNRLTVGVEYQNHLKSSITAATDDGTVFFDEDIPFTVVSVYLVDEYQLLEGLQFTLGARYDRHSKDGSSATTPRGAVVYTPFASSDVRAHLPRIAYSSLLDGA